MRALTREAGSAEDEAALKNRRAYGSAEMRPEPTVGHNHFGLVVVSCEGADLRPTATGVMVYADDARRLEPVEPPTVPRAEVLDELCDAVDGVRPAVHTGEWARATLAACLAILASSREQREIVLHGN